MAVASALFFILSLIGCATYKPLLGTSLPALVIADTKAALLKAKKQDSTTHAPLETERAQEALNQAEELWNKHKRSDGSTGNLQWDDEIREKALHAKLYAQMAQAISRQKKIEQQIAKTEVDRLKYDSLKKQYQTEVAQIRTIITKQQKLEAERQAAEMRAQQETRAKEDAQKYARLAEAAKQEALQQMALAKQVKEEVQRQKELAEAARMEALRAKALAEAAKQEALQEKQLAEIAKQGALREKQLAEAARQKAQQETEAAKQQLREMQKKLMLLSTEFAKVKQEKRGLVVTLSDILFDVDKASIRPGAAKNLSHLAQILKEYPGRKILIEGHTDSTGSAEYNQTLSEERAFSVMGHLMSQGLDPQGMDAMGFGKTKPVATNDTPEGRQQNRRVDIIILNPES